jgi:predicted GNAT family acetyltransferase
VSEVAALIEWYERRQRTPRPEYLAKSAPLVEPALASAGFEAEGRLPVMVFDRGAARVAAPDGITIRRPVTVEDTRGMLEVQAEAYGEPPPSDADVHRQRDETDIGSRALIAEDSGRGLVVGAGSSAPVAEGMAEVAAIGVAATHRRRGIATVLANHLALDAIARGARTPFLMAAHDQERRIYERSGYIVAGEILHISRRRSR